jgi:ABC-type antimicrobial peptide transport system permease subunit
VVKVLGFFAGASLLLAVLGLYGVISYSVSQRTQEIGVRIALGSPSRSVLAMVFGDGLRLAGTGIAIGLAAAAISARWLKAQLFGVGTLDPLAFCLMPMALLCAALLASYIPARRAISVDPATALREE